MSGVFSRRGAPPKPAAPPPPAASEPDPSMEDILASIRRILNEGESETEEATTGETLVAEPPAPEPVMAAPPPPPPAPTPVAEVQPPPPVDEQKASVTPAESVKADDVFILEPAMMVSENAAATAEADVTPIASTETVAAASQSVGALKKAISERHAQIYKATAVSLEEIVREEVRPMLKDWLDNHLPAIVERLVRAEIERVVAREIL